MSALDSGEVIVLRWSDGGFLARREAPDGPDWCAFRLYIPQAVLCGYESDLSITPMKRVMMFSGQIQNDGWIDLPLSSAYVSTMTLNKMACGDPPTKLADAGQPRRFAGPEIAKRVIDNQLEHAALVLSHRLYDILFATRLLDRAQRYKIHGLDGGGPPRMWKVSSDLFAIRPTEEDTVSWEWATAGLVGDVQVLLGAPPPVFLPWPDFIGVAG